jgi:hypothetical protein
VSNMRMLLQILSRYGSRRKRSLIIRRCYSNVSLKRQTHNLKSRQMEIWQMFEVGTLRTLIGRSIVINLQPLQNKSTPVMTFRQNKHLSAHKISKTKK